MFINAPLSAAPGGRSRRRASAFTLMQTLVSVSIGSVCVAAVVPKVRQSEKMARANIVVADLRTFATAFETQAQEAGAWPAETSAGEMPPEMQNRLGETGWVRIAPIGGKYNWENDQMHGGVRYKAILSISETADSPLPIDEEVLTAIDTIMDDGNLATGQVRTGVNHDLIYILQQ